MAEYLDKGGLSHLITLLKGYFVKQVEGKGLSTNDFTDTQRDKLAGLENYNDTAIRGLIDGKVSKETGKSLMLDTEITRLAGVTNYDDAGVRSLIDGKQDTLVSGSNIKTINGKDVTGSGNLVIETGITTVAWDDVTGKPDSYKPSAHTHQQSEITGLDTTITNLTAIANGKCMAFVYATEQDFINAMGTVVDGKLTYEGKEYTLKVGDVFLIIATNVPDYWWTNVADAEGKKYAMLETTKVDISAIPNEDITKLLNGETV